MTLPRTAAQVLSGHVRLEVRCIDRLLLTFRQPRSQYGQGIHGFFCHHRGNQFVSSALMLPMTERFAADIRHYIDSRGLDLVRFAKGQSKDQIFFWKKRGGGMLTSVLVVRVPPAEALAAGDHSILTWALASSPAIASWYESAPGRPAATHSRWVCRTASASAASRSSAEARRSSALHRRYSSIGTISAASPPRCMTSC